VLASTNTTLAGRPRMIGTIGHGHENVRVNVRREVMRIRKDPMRALLNLRGEKIVSPLAAARYREAYALYSAAMERALEQLSAATRFRKGPYYILKYGGRYGPGQRKLAKKASYLRRFFDLDVYSSLLFSRILLDRTAGLSRSFLSGARLPSFTSFSDHKKFLAKGNHDVPAAYADRVINQTDWFEVPLKIIRDKFIVHAGPPCYRLDTIPWQGDDLLIKFQPTSRDAGGAMEDAVGLNLLTLSGEVEEFLAWFAKSTLQN